MKRKNKQATLADNDRVNWNFNRIENADQGHFYIRELGGNYKKTVTKGIIKCKLAHGVKYSIIVPDLLFIGKDATHWIQPLSFHANQLTKLSETDIECVIQIDISCRESVRARFNSKDFIIALEDGSALYKCNILGPPNLLTYHTGTSQLVHNVPFLRLYHHTTEVNYKAINATSHFFLSSWHIQGVAKKLTNVGYAYFTCLDRIKYDQDLHEIGMSSEGKIHLLIDNFEPPEDFTSKDAENHPDEVLALDVYRQSTDSRTHAIGLMIDSSMLAPQHLYRHSPKDRAVYYQSCMPFTYRVGMLPGEKLFFEKGKISRDIQRPNTLKAFDYLIIGDATNTVGLKAPYDEEDTRDIAKIQRIPHGSNILRFWFENGNSDLYSAIGIEYQGFKTGAS